MFRPMIRQNKQLAAQECAEVLRIQTRGVLSVIGDDGYPYGTPMNHWYDDRDGSIWFHSGDIGHRLEALQRQPKASFCVFEPGVRAEGEWAWTVRSVIVFGRVEIVRDASVIAQVAAALSRKFTQDEAYIQREIEQHAHRTVLLHLVPEHICGKRVKEA